MDIRKQYVTQLSASDLEEIARAANLKAGFGLTLQLDGDSLVISLSEEAIKSIMWLFYANGGTYVSYSDLNSVDVTGQQGI